MRDIAKFIVGFQRFQQNFFCKEAGVFEYLKNAQKPRVLMVGCSDSRVDPAILTDCAPGEIFVVRNVGNLVPPFEDDSAYHGVSAAVEYAVQNLEVEHVIVMGHCRCGGISRLMDDMRPGKDDIFVTRWVQIAARARERVLEELKDKPRHMQEMACEQASILVSLENLLTFPFVRARVEAGTLTLHGWYFDMDHGDLLSYLPETGQFEPLVPVCEKL